MKIIDETEGDLSERTHHLGALLVIIDQLLVTLTSGCRSDWTRSRTTHMEKNCSQLGAAMRAIPPKLGLADHIPYRYEKLYWGASPTFEE